MRVRFRIRHLFALLCLAGVLSWPAAARAQQYVQTRVQLYLDSLQAWETTDVHDPKIKVFGNEVGSNDRDEVYFVVKGKHGKKSFTVPRISPHPPEDYYGLSKGQVLRNILLWDGVLLNNEAVTFVVTIAEQDNAQRQALQELVNFGTLTVPELAGDALTGDWANFAVTLGESLYAIGKELDESLRKHGDQTIGAFAVTVVCADGKVSAHWQALAHTKTDQPNYHYMAFTANGHKSHYTGSVRLDSFAVTGSYDPAELKKVRSLIDELAIGDADRLVTVVRRTHENDWSGAAEDLIYGLRREPAAQQLVLRYFPHAVRYAGECVKQQVNLSDPVLTAQGFQAASSERVQFLVDTLVKHDRGRIDKVVRMAKCNDWSGAAEDLVYGVRKVPDAPQQILQHFPLALRHAATKIGDKIELADPKVRAHHQVAIISFEVLRRVGPLRPDNLSVKPKQP
ncbi:MAG: hypothetical protein L0215_19095 [Gemmataceae bacterium]|nr:hypothetical protein [Gemmataceae bacterium]